jgi:hypothetical protein
MDGGETVAAWPQRLGFWRNAGKAKPSCACGSSGGGYGRAWGCWLVTGVSEEESSPAALMAGGSGLQCYSGAREERQGKFI